jgi:hypothetical protein
MGNCVERETGFEAEEEPIDSKQVIMNVVYIYIIFIICRNN